MTEERTCSTCCHLRRNALAGRCIVEATISTYTENVREGETGMESIGTRAEGSIRKRFLLRTVEVSASYRDPVIIASASDPKGLCMVHTSWRTGSETCDQHLAAFGSSRLHPASQQKLGPGFSANTNSQSQSQLPDRTVRQDSNQRDESHSQSPIDNGQTQAVAKSQDEQNSSNSPSTKPTPIPGSAA